ncbi:MAG TPA: (Fe-S)-binding protein, partial [Bacteroidetes bacterium]|nr:(Fe-S)-binding protein [Bacteroidota bacterium]
MNKNKNIKIKDFSKGIDQLVTLDPADLPQLPYPYEDWQDPPYAEIPESKKKGKDLSLDGILNVVVPVPETKEEKEQIVAKFLSGLRKLLTKENNWMFLEQLML